MDGSRSANRIRAVTGSVMSPSSGGAMARNNHDVAGNLTPILFTYQASGYHKMMMIAREHCSFPNSRRSPAFLQAGTAGRRSPSCDQAHFLYTSTKVSHRLINTSINLKNHDI